MVEKVGALGKFINTMAGFGSEDVGALADDLAALGTRLHNGKAALKNNIARANEACDKLDALNATFGNNPPSP